MNSPVIRAYRKLHPWLYKPNFLIQEYLEYSTCVNPWTLHLHAKSRYASGQFLNEYIEYIEYLFLIKLIILASDLPL